MQSRCSMKKPPPCIFPILLIMERLNPASVPLHPGPLVTKMARKCLEAGAHKRACHRPKPERTRGNRQRGMKSSEHDSILATRACRQAGRRRWCMPSNSNCATTTADSSANKHTFLVLMKFSPFPPNWSRNSRFAWQRRRRHQSWFSKGLRSSWRISSCQ